MATAFEKFAFQVKHTAEDYYKMIPSLLPKGVIWGIDELVIGVAEVWQNTIDSLDVKQNTPDAPEVLQNVPGLGDTHSSGSELGRLISCFMSELARIEADAWGVLNQTDPGVATSLLTDWIAQLGIDTDDKTVDEIQTEAHAKMFDEFVTTTTQAYIDYAETFGFTIEVNEAPAQAQPRIMGVARMGVERMGGRGGFSLLEIVVLAGDPPLQVLVDALNGFKAAHAILIFTDQR